MINYAEYMAEMLRWWLVLEYIWTSRFFAYSGRIVNKHNGTYQTRVSFYFYYRFLERIAHELCA